MAGKILGLSFDKLSEPELTLKPLRTPDGRPASWGLAWYSEAGDAATIIKDPDDQRDEPLDGIHAQERFQVTTLVLHTRSPAAHTSQKNTQPFARGLARRDLVFAHSGDLSDEVRRALRPGPEAAYEPAGQTDSEWAFCWLLEQLRGVGARQLADAGWERLRLWLRQINAFGVANLIVSDGIDLVGYRDAEAAGTLNVMRRTPPDADPRIQNQEMALNLAETSARTPSVAIVATDPFWGEPWVMLEPSEMVVLRRGQVTWDSRTMPAPREQREQVAIQSQHGQPTGGVARPIAAPAATDETSAHYRVLQVEHETTYRYGGPVQHSVHTLRLTPVWDPEQQVLDFALTTTPAGQRQAFEDVFGNRAVQMTLTSGYTEFKVHMAALVRIGGEAFREPPHRRMTVPLVWMPWQRQLMHAYLLPPELPETQLHELSEFAMSFVERRDYDVYEALCDLNRTMYQDFQYVPGSTTLETTAFEAYAQRRGVCQDFANLFICLARLLGVPARYRVGYIYTGANYANKIQSDASHAWAEVYLPTMGWRGFDPTNGCEVGLDHIRVATGRTYRDATPTSGTIFKGGGDEELSISVRVTDQTAKFTALGVTEG